MAEVLFHEKVVKENGDIIEMRIIKVPKSEAHPQGLRYALVYIRNHKRLIGYDNFEGKGHHRHYLKNEKPYNFQSVAQLIKDFQQDIQNLSGGTP